MAQEPSYDFPVISVREAGEAEPDLSKQEPGKTEAWEETLYQDVGGNWQEGEWGQKVGTVMLREYLTKNRRRTPVRAWFMFDDGETVEYAGLVPGNGSWSGRGRLGYRGGTGRFADRGGELDVESTNPKRWG
jgi:hypothetical protein